MRFHHEASIDVPGSPSSVLADWTDMTCLPHILSHVRATTLGDMEDIGRVVMMLDGSHIEFAAQRTMCDSDTVCWQSLGNDFEYVLVLTTRSKPESTEIVLNCSYDPPGFLADVVEKLGFSHTFQTELESDLQRYARTFLETSDARKIVAS